MDQGLESLVSELASRFPGCVVKTDEPLNPVTMPTFVDLSWNGHGFAVEYRPPGAPQFRPSGGYGVSALPTEGYGDGPDAIVQTLEDLVGWIKFTGRIRDLIPSRVPDV
ncbi:MAG: hypothetical protein BWY99_02628 [Synergistetes bacterium ADurb.BinA166]|nr:MAG: hypothetical protein BWY99_02628 [Synergistetes bacterium ADurb.BinA166]